MISSLDSLLNKELTKQQQSYTTLNFNIRLIKLNLATLRF